MGLTLADRVAFARDRARAAGYDMHADLSDAVYEVYLIMFDERIGDYPPDERKRAIRAVRRGLVP